MDAIAAADARPRADAARGPPRAGCAFLEPARASDAVTHPSHGETRMEDADEGSDEGRDALFCIYTYFCDPPLSRTSGIGAWAARRPGRRLRPPPSRGLRATDGARHPHCLSLKKIGGRYLFIAMRVTDRSRDSEDTQKRLSLSDRPLCVCVGARAHWTPPVRSESRRAALGTRE